MNNLVLIINLAVAFMALVGFFDALRRRSAAFDFIGKGSRTAWLIGLGLAAPVVFLGGIFHIMGVIATIATIVYHVEIRQRLMEL
ncbi:MAG: DUF2516 family protein [Candidatus Nanopelagicales bacterium]